ncbi:hypothetical protein PILCRDRAFT_830176 [Piloderma croceum F 1598]|uniref:Uncharacterized protein n=1 Tax=Piloderma croceum (strain F 1598) TaxID=765440 RepID=A0A0C3EUK9_PILCF|nr:hypothetical protein PILCRDRAFT_830176 [Piloderma croceum F 1598]
MIHFAFELLDSYPRSIQSRLMDFYNAKVIDSVFTRLKYIISALFLLGSSNRTQLASFADV